MMMPKERLFAAFDGKKTDRAPWVPFAGVHAGFLKGYSATEVLCDPDKLFESLMEVNRLYRPDGQPVVFDLQLEAEILGCGLAWADDAPPSVRTHPFEGADSLPDSLHIPEPTEGRLPAVLDVMRRMKSAVGESTALFGLVTGPFTLAGHLRGNDIFMDMYDDPEGTLAFVNLCAGVCRRMAEYYAAAGMDVIALVDPLVSQVSSDHFSELLSEAFSSCFAAVRDMSLRSAFFVCGNATRNLEVMCGTGPDAIFVDENVDLAAAKKLCGARGVTVGGNIPLTSVMLLGSQQENMKCVIDELDGVDGAERLVIAPGCDMPYAVPVENVIAVTQAVIHSGETREMLKNYTASGDDADVELPDYGKLPRPLMEVFTLDSATCAACAYMMGAANEAKAAFGDRIDMVEYKFTKKENIARCKKLGVKNLPSIYINGNLEFSSLIPRRDELAAAVEKYLK